MSFISLSVSGANLGTTVVGASVLIFDFELH